MRRSTTSKTKQLRAGLAIGFWLALWGALSVWGDYTGAIPDMLFAGPVQTAQSLFGMLGTAACWRSIGSTLGKIAVGFLLAFALGLLLGLVCHRFEIVRLLLEPAVVVMKSVPVACFVIVALIWVDATSISVLLSAFVVFPVTYHGVLEGLAQVDRQMLEMAEVFRMPFARRLRYLYIPAVMPYILASCRVSVGMCWKAGVAGEVIGLPRYSIGEQLYLAKNGLEIGEIFAWTLLIIAISLVSEKLVLRAVTAVQRKMEDAYAG